MTKREPTIYTITKAAERIGVSRQTVWNWLNDGTLDEEPSFGYHRLVTAASIERVIAQRQVAS